MLRHRAARFAQPTGHLAASKRPWATFVGPWGEGGNRGGVRRDPWQRPTENQTDSPFPRNERLPGRRPPSGAQVPVAAPFCAMDDQTPNVFRWVADGAERLQQLRAQREAAQSAREGGNGRDSSPFPFVNLFRTLGEACPMRVVESPNHCTVELEIPMGLQLDAPKITETNSATGAFKVTAEILKPRSPQQKLSPDPLEGDPMTEFFRSMGLNVNLQNEALGTRFTRSLHLPPTVYAVEGARPFLEDGALRVYVPKRTVSSSPKPVGSDSSTDAHQKDARPSDPRNSGPRRAYSPPRSAEAAATTTATTPPRTQPEPQGQQQSSKAAAQPVTRAQAPGVFRHANELSHAPWPPTASLVVDDAKQAVYEFKLPAAVGTDNISIDFDAAAHKLCVEVKLLHRVATPVSEEVQNLSYKRWLEVDASVIDAEGIETELQPQDGTLRIIVQKPQPKPSAPSVVRIPVGKKSNTAA